jgi:hypothetical protein
MKAKIIFTLSFFSLSFSSFTFQYLSYVGCRQDVVWFLREHILLLLLGIVISTDFCILLPTEIFFNEQNFFQLKYTRKSSPWKSLSLITLPRQLFKLFKHGQNENFRTLLHT